MCFNWRISFASVSICFCLLQQKKPSANEVHAIGINSFCNKSAVCQNHFVFITCLISLAQKWLWKSMYCLPRFIFLLLLLLKKKVNLHIFKIYLFCQFFLGGYLLALPCASLILWRMPLGVRVEPGNFTPHNKVN